MQNTNNELTIETVDQTNKRNFNVSAHHGFSIVLHFIWVYLFKPFVELALWQSTFKFIHILMMNQSKSSRTDVCSCMTFCHILIKCFLEVEYLNAQSNFWTFFMDIFCSSHKVFDWFPQKVFRNILSSPFELVFYLIEQYFWCSFLIFSFCYFLEKT